MRPGFDEDPHRTRDAESHPAIPIKKTQNGASVSEAGPIGDARDTTARCYVSQGPTVTLSATATSPATGTCAIVDASNNGVGGYLDTAPE